jgi:hypothetical protein
MKQLILLFFITTISLNTIAQQKPTDLDKSPMDMSYWPKDYPLLKMTGKSKDAPTARIIYGRPQKNGREIFGGINRYNEIWRLGANEATEIEFFKNVKIDGKVLSKGRYTIFCIPQENKWTLIFNKDNFCWGSFNYDAKKDVFRADMKIEKIADITEALTLYFDDNKSGANFIIMWDNIKATLPISL